MRRLYLARLAFPFQFGKGFHFGNASRGLERDKAGPKAGIST
jgi:hypothetical protein